MPISSTTTAVEESTGGVSVAWVPISVWLRCTRTTDSQNGLLSYTTLENTGKRSHLKARFLFGARSRGLWVASVHEAEVLLSSLINMVLVQEREPDRHAETLPQRWEPDQHPPAMLGLELSGTLGQVVCCQTMINVCQADQQVHQSVLC